MNFYSASVALLWLTALRAGAAPELSGRSHCEAGNRKVREGFRSGAEFAARASRRWRPRAG
jgi:hypothetical protein